MKICLGIAAGITVSVLAHIIWKPALGSPPSEARPRMGAIERRLVSDVREVNRAHEAVKTDLQRRRELKRLSKPELIDYIVRVEDSLAVLSDRIDHAYGDEP